MKNEYKQLKCGRCGKAKHKTCPKTPVMALRRQEQERGVEILDWLENYVCTCKKSNKKLGRNVYSCFLCEPKRKKETKKEKEERKAMYLLQIIRNAQGFPKINKLLEKESKRFDELNG